MEVRIEKLHRPDSIGGVAEAMFRWAAVKNFFDVVIVGGGLSGIGAACRLKSTCPHLTFTILEARDRWGGTWDFFKYPGLRSDSDMHTYAFPFMPWTGDEKVVDARTILNYLTKTVAAYDLQDTIQFNALVVQADWHSHAARWRLTVQHQRQGHRHQVACRFLLICAGYYDYQEAHRPHFEGEEVFRGEMIHPQFWQPNQQVNAKKIVLIGSGATSVTMAPALAKAGAHTIIVQRSPSHMIAWPRKDHFASLVNRVFPTRTAFMVVRLKNLVQQQLSYGFSRRCPNMTARLLQWNNTRALRGKVPLTPHFEPNYPPWQQRVCVAPDSDLFLGLRTGQIEIKTGRIKTLTEEGVLMANGDRIAADIIVTATGLKLSVLGRIHVSVDGHTMDFGQRLTYRGFAYSDVPNLISVFGYVNASWTLRSDLVSRYACRLFNYLDKTGRRSFTPTPSPEAFESTRPMVDNFTPGYLMRSIHRLPKQGSRAPWTNPQNYFVDYIRCVHWPIDDGHITFS